MRTVCSFAWFVRVLIDTWWNVNLDGYKGQDCLILVLIDTWWNVNTERPDINIFHAVVLIDTWWNVNDEYLIAHTNIISFNRYMVECESVVFASMTTTVDSFNRYMVECECA